MALEAALGNALASAGFCVPTNTYFQHDNVWLVVAANKSHTTYAFYNEAERAWCSAGLVAIGDMMWGHTAAKEAGLAFPDPAFAPGASFAVRWSGRLGPFARRLLDNAHLSAPRAATMILGTSLGSLGNNILIALRECAADDPQVPPLARPRAGVYPNGAPPTADRAPYTDSFIEALERYGDTEIHSIVVCRTPLSATSALLASMLLRKEYRRLNSVYDQLYHTYAVLHLRSGEAMLLEKNATLVFKPLAKDATGLKLDKTGTELARLGVGTPRKLLAKVAAQMGQSYSSYEALHNNCQIFVLNVMTAAASAARDYIYQPVGPVDESTRRRSEALTTIYANATRFRDNVRRQF